MSLFPCPCCGYRTLERVSPGSFDICPICGWEDDPEQFADPELEGGANALSLRRAQAKAREDEKRGRLSRRPALDESRDPDWRFLDP